MGKKKDKKTPAEGMESTALEKRLAERAALETEEEEAPTGPKNMKEAREQIAEVNERLLRLIAEYDNFRKRAQRDKDEARQFANQNLIEKQIPILDNFEMALAAARRGELGLLFGNLLGSNLFNSLTVGSAVFLANGGKPHDEASRLPVGSLLIMVAVSWLVIVVMRTGRRISRGEAFVLLAVYGVVLGWLAVTGATA